MRFNYIAAAVATVVLALALGLAPSLARAQAPTQSAAASCGQLANAANAAKFLAIGEAPTTVVSATIVKAGGEGTIIDKDLPEICRVEGIIPPSIGFLLRMPTKNWNGKFMMGGCGSSCGNFLEDRIDPALVRNYAVVTTDMGHKAINYSQFTNTLQGQVDFGYRSTHVTAVAAKVLVAEFYGQKASRNYFWGCSTGGGQAMVEAQLYPNDFEGIIAGSPVLGTSPGAGAGTWRADINRGADDKPILLPARLPLVHQAVLEACDGLDGLKDGILQNPRQCTWDPSAIRCAPGQTTEKCLSADEVEVVRRFYTGPVDSKGQPIAWALMERGSENQWGRFEYPGVEIPGLLAVAPKGSAAPRPRMEPWFRNALNPDLRALKRSGTKLILFTSWNDNNISPGSAVDYYETATKALGGEKATKEFFRFFALPSANHCRYGIGGGEADWITYLENWVEKGQAPDSVIAYHMRQEPYPYLPRKIRDYGAAYTLMPRFPLPQNAYDRARPVYAYPDVAMYSGSGDPAKPESWKMAPRSAGQ